MGQPRTRTMLWLSCNPVGVQTAISSDRRQKALGWRLKINHGIRSSKDFQNSCLFDLYLAYKCKTVTFYLRSGNFFFLIFFNVVTTEISVINLFSENLKWLTGNVLLRVLWKFLCPHSDNPKSWEPFPSWLFFYYSYP